MSRKPLFLISGGALLLSVFAAGMMFSAQAAAFDPSDLIDDPVFDNSSAMSANQIDNSFLNTFSGSCISSSSGFRTPDPQGWSTSSNAYTFGGNVTAGTAIADSANRYSISPATLLTTMQKEQSLFTGSAGCYNSPNPAATVPTSLTCTPGSATSTTCTKACTFAGGCLNIGLGYGCPYYCKASQEGFSNQLIRAAWNLRFSQQRAYGNLTGYSGFDSGDQNIYYSGPMTEGWRQRSASDSSNFYDGTYTTSDGVSINVTNGATASLYTYTPFTSGNRNFDSIFENYFGGIRAGAYAAAMVSQSAFPSLNPGQSTTVYIEYQNQGGWSWYDDTGISSAPAGTNPVHLAVYPYGTASPFSSSGWANAYRPAVNFSAVYGPDGTTLTNNQHVALPGQIVKFSFTVTAPWMLSPGTYQQFFQPVAEGTPTGGFGNTGTYLNVGINPNPNVALNSQSAFPTIVPSASKQVSLSFTNTGNTPLYDDTSAPAGFDPVHLATDCPINSTSPFSAGWPNSARPAVNFSAVYNADGTTLASSQHIAQPGQIMKFTFNLTVPPGYSAGTYKACFQPILEGTPTGYFPDLGVYLNVTVPSTAVTVLSGLPSSLPVAGGEPKSLTLNVQNVGNADLPSGTTIITDNGGSFRDPSWSDASTLATISQTIAAGTTISAVPVTILAPSVTSQTTVPLHLMASSSSTLTSNTSTISTTVYPANYHVAFAGESAFPTLSYGQNSTIFLSYKNTGNLPWRDDTGLSGQDTRNTKPLHLATALPLNRNSGFATTGWTNAGRPAETFAAVYEADGTTLASNQHVAQPGQIVKFSFSVSPQGWVKPGIYREFFQPIAEGISDGGTNFVGSYLDFTVPSLTSQYQASFVTQSSFPTITPGQSSAAFLRYKNTGSATWYDDSDVPSGMSPAHLATTNPINRTSSFSSGWPAGSRPDVTFSKVYESDGTTQASNQHAVQPGQIVEFDFNLTAPSGMQPGNYREYFQPILEGSPSWGVLSGLAWLDVTVQ